MKISKSFKYRLLTNKEQDLAFSGWAGCCRFIYNLGLSERKNAWEQDKTTLSYVTQANKLKDLKKAPETEWLREPPAQLLQQSLRDLDQAYKNFFTRIKKGLVGAEAGFPRFKKKGKSVDAFRFPDPTQFSTRKVSNKKSMIKLPKIGEVKFFNSREIEGEIRNCTISRDGKYWYISFNCEMELARPNNHRHLGTMIGIDRGIANTMVTSEGKIYQLSIGKIKKIEQRKSVLQKRGRKKKKFSRNWTRKIRSIAKLDRRIFRVRHDFLHKTSTTIAKNHSYIVMEDLRVKNMSKTASGTTENPGTNVNAKSALNRSILRQGWYKFQILLEYKSAWNGGYVSYIDPKNTSRKCSKCGHTEKDNRLTQESFCCKKCGLELNADYNAAINIFTQGHWGSACGDAGIGRIDEARTNYRT
ncbi:MAG: transposase [Oligoflexia bacterium]|nr:transposase [Oligoflexia bacterium]